ncbi:MAG: MFS transporter [Planctomycetota bacterium]|nr:MFS transporter [Planctomycetota bacterium]MDA1214138.1 MFS transporter [Planctomycetota bacterium]
MMDSKPRRTGLVIVFLTVMIDLLGFGIVIPLLPRYGKYFEAEGMTLGLLMSSFSAMQFVFAPIWGRISDRVGRRPILILGLAGSTISYALFGWATGFEREATVAGMSALTWLFVTRIGAGIFGATIPTAQAYIADVTDSTQRSRGMALIGAAFGVGFTFGPLIGAFFVTEEVGGAPSAGPGYVAAVLSGIACLYAMVKLPESLKSDSRPSGHHWLDISSLRMALGRPSIGVILATMFLTTFAFAQFEVTLSLLTQHLGLGQRYNFYVFAYIGFILALSQGFLVRRLLPIWGENRLALIGTVLMSIGLLLIGLTAQQQSLSMLFAIVPLATIGFSAVTPSLQSLLSLQSLESEQGGILGVGQSMSALARIGGPFVGTILYFQHISYPYWAGTVLMTVGIGMVAMLKRPVKIETEQATAAE